MGGASTIYGCGQPRSVGPSGPDRRGVATARVSWNRSVASAPAVVRDTPPVTPVASASGDPVRRAASAARRRCGLRRASARGGQREALSFGRERNASGPTPSGESPATLPVARAFGCGWAKRGAASGRATWSEGSSRSLAGSSRATSASGRHVRACGATRQGRAGAVAPLRWPAPLTGPGPPSGGRWWVASPTARSHGTIRTTPGSARIRRLGGGSTIGERRFRPRSVFTSVGTPGETRGPRRARQPLWWRPSEPEAQRVLGPAGEVTSGGRAAPKAATGAGWRTLRCFATSLFGSVAAGRFGDTPVRPPANGASASREGERARRNGCPSPVLRFAGGRAATGGSSDSPPGRRFGGRRGSR